MAGPIRVSQVWGGEAVPLLRDFFFEFQVKKQGFMHFYCEKQLVARNWDRRRGNNRLSWGLKM